MVADQTEFVPGNRVQVKRFEAAVMVGLGKGKELNMVSKDSRMSGKVTDTSRKNLVASRKPRVKKPVG